MSFKVDEHHFPVYDWQSRTTEGGPAIKAQSFIVARWDMSDGTLPTMGDVMAAVSEMHERFPGRQKDYRIMGVPKPGDFLFGVEVA